MKSGKQLTLRELIGTRPDCHERASGTPLCSAYPRSTRSLGPFGGRRPSTEGAAALTLMTNLASGFVKSIGIAQTRGPGFCWGPGRIGRQQEFGEEERDVGMRAGLPQGPVDRGLPGGTGSSGGFAKPLSLSIKREYGPGEMWLAGYRMVDGWSMCSGLTRREASTRCDPYCHLLWQAGE